MPGGDNNEINALYAIACSTRQMAINAGATPPDQGYVNDEDALSQTIACNIYVTNQALGGTCAPLWVDGFTAWQAILQMSVEMMSLTGGGTPQGFLELPQQGVFCNLQQVATNTGEAASGDFGGNEGDLTLLNSIACVTAQIAANGFAPDPVTELIDAINAFSPDIFVMADRGVGSSNGDPANPWQDQSGHGSNFVTGTDPSIVAPVLDLASLNGKNTVNFVGAPGAPRELQAPFVNADKSATIIAIVVLGTQINAAPRLITSAQVDGGGDVDGDPTPIFSYITGGNTLNTYPSGATKGITSGAPAAVAVNFDGTNAQITVNGSAGGTAAIGGNMAITLICLGCASNGDDSLGVVARFAAVVAWKASQSAPTIASVTNLLRSYYGF